jgi:hypothetical protein
VEEAEATESRSSFRLLWGGGDGFLNLAQQRVLTPLAEGKLHNGLNVQTTSCCDL